MISFDALPGNRSLKASLRRALAGRVPQTILLSGDDSRSLETLSTALAAGILCEADGPRPCGACLSCRKVQDGVHPDLTLIDEGEDELKVDLARRIKAENAIIPNDGARRVTVIRHAHNMNAYAQNALLKELEEPPHFAFFILTSEKPDALLQTVRSRCTRFALEPSGEEQAVSDDEATRLLAPYLTAVAGKREGSMMLAALGMEKTPRRALIGVMGSMLAAAHEKTGEIGILLALGAQPHDIRRTFLLQAVLLCLFGGIVGLAAAGALLHFGAALLLPEGRVFAGLLTLSTLSGAAAGLLPAVRAAALDPIDAICK